MIATDITLSFTAENEPQFTLTANITRTEALKMLEEYNGILSRGKTLDVTIKQYRKKRSLDANSMLWAILGKMAAALNTDKDELYLEVLARYGVFTHLIVKPEVVERVKREWRTVRELGEVTVNGKTGIQLQCFFGSSTYDQAEFSVLLDGVVSEAKEIGIDVITEEEKCLLLAEWGTIGEGKK